MRRISTTPWSPGMLDIHKISTGRGNSPLLVLPDGTTVLVDAARPATAFRRPTHTPMRRGRLGSGSPVTCKGTLPGPRHSTTYLSPIFTPIIMGRSCPGLLSTPRGAYASPSCRNGRGIPRRRARPDRPSPPVAHPLQRRDPQHDLERRGMVRPWRLDTGPPPSRPRLDRGDRHGLPRRSTTLKPAHTWFEHVSDARSRDVDR